MKGGRESQLALATRRPGISTYSCEPRLSFGPKVKEMAWSSHQHPLSETYFSRGRAYTHLVSLGDVHHALPDLLCNSVGISRRDERELRQESKLSLPDVERRGGDIDHADEDVVRPNGGGRQLDGSELRALGREYVCGVHIQHECSCCVYSCAFNG